MVEVEDVIIPDSEVTIATKDMLHELYPIREKNQRAFIRVNRKPIRNAILHKYRGKSNSLSARGFDTTELDNMITIEQNKIDTIYTMTI